MIQINCQNLILSLYTYIFSFRILIPFFSIRKNLFQFIPMKILNNLESFLDTSFLDKTFMSHLSYSLILNIMYFMIKVQTIIWFCKSASICQKEKEIIEDLYLKMKNLDFFLPTFLNSLVSCNETRIIKNARHFIEFMKECESVSFTLRSLLWDIKNISLNFAAWPQQIIAESFIMY